MSHRHVVGNVRERSLLDLWLDPSYVAYRERVQGLLPSRRAPSAAAAICPKRTRRTAWQHGTRMRRLACGLRASSNARERVEMALSPASLHRASRSTMNAFRRRRVHAKAT